MLSTGLAGLGAATRRLDEAAFDVARASSQRLGRAPSPADASPPGQAPGGAAGAGTPPDTTVPGAPPRGADAAAPADADLPRAMVDLISASNQVLANLQTIRRGDEALRALLEAPR